jgi:curved DNA-binding protein CbpA
VSADTPTYDYYEVLGVSADASAEDIKQAVKFQRLAFHPDRFPPGRNKEQAEEQTKLINQAYDVLKDSSSRRLYDEKRSRLTYHQSERPYTDPHQPQPQAHQPTKPTTPRQTPPTRQKQFDKDNYKWSISLPRIVWPIVAVLCVLVPTLIGDSLNFDAGAQGWLALLEFVFGCIRVFGTFFALWATAAVWLSKEDSSSK